MSPVPLALGSMLQEEGWRGTRAEGVVQTLGVVEDEPVGELAVEDRKVGEEQLLAVAKASNPQAAALAGRVGQHLQGGGGDLPGFSGLAVPPQGLVSPAAVGAAGRVAHLVGGARF